MKRELVESYSDWNEIRLEVYSLIASELIELEGECEKMMDELKSYIEKYHSAAQAMKKTIFQ